MVVHVYTEQMPAQKFFSQVGFDPSVIQQTDKKPIKYDQTGGNQGSNGTFKNASKDEPIVVIGTGDLAKALVTCLTRKGYRVVVASRNPKKNRAQVENIGGEIDNYEDALDQGNIVIAAIPMEGFSSLPADLLEGKIVIDVSNRPLKNTKHAPSLASKLQAKLPDSKVVKAFNTLSAYGLQKNLFQGSKEVPVCSDDEEAKFTVMSLVRNMGFTPVDRGNLSSASEIEDITLAFFPEWKLAGILTLSFMIFSLFILFFRRQLCKNFVTTVWNWTLFDDILLVNFQRSYGLTAITLLSLCYLPGVIASYIQLFRGTKYSEFPNWLDNWLQSRKYIGLLAFYCAAMHVLMSILDIIEDDISHTWQTYSYMALGSFAIGMMSILSITSLPSVSESLTWREFSFVQRYLGWWTLFLSMWHFIFAKWNDLFADEQRCVVIPDEGQIFFWLPAVTLVLKFVLILPCVDWKLQKIRRGYEGNPTDSRVPVQKRSLQPFNNHGGVGYSNDDDVNYSNDGGVDNSNDGGVDNSNDGGWDNSNDGGGDNSNDGGGDNSNV